MDINSIGGINNNIVDYSITNAKNKAESNEFEKKLKKAYSEKDEKQLKKVCKDFEQIFLKMMYDQMRATIPKADLEEDSFARNTFEDMFYEKVSEEVANGPGVGLGDMLYKSLSKEMKNAYTTAGDKKDESKTDIPEDK